MVDLRKEVIQELLAIVKSVSESKMSDHVKVDILEKVARIYKYIN